MKIIPLVTGLMALLWCHPVSGQALGSYGVKGGISLSNQSFRINSLDFEMDTEPIAGPSLIFFIEAMKGNHLSIQTDLGFSCRGSSTTTQSVTVNHLDQNRLVVNTGEKTVSRFRYLSMSPMLRARTNNGGFEPYGLLGPRLDLLLGYSTTSEYPLEEQNNLILGLSIGAGVEYTIRGKGIFVEVQFQPDLSPVTNHEPLLINNNSLLFSLGIRWISSPKAS